VEVTPGAGQKQQDLLLQVLWVLLQAEMLQQAGLQQAGVLLQAGMLLQL
jgi:hypothetical protein